MLHIIRWERWSVNATFFGTFHFNLPLSHSKAHHPLSSLSHSLNVFFFFQQIFYSSLSFSLFHTQNWLIADMAECKVLKLSHHQAEATTHPLLQLQSHRQLNPVVKRQQVIISRLPQIIATHIFIFIIAFRVHTMAKVNQLIRIICSSPVAVPLAFVRQSLSWISSQHRRRILQSTNSMIAY